LVISAATFPFTYGSSFDLEFLDKSGKSSEQHHRIFTLVRTGYQALFNLSDSGDASYVQNRTTGKSFQDAKRNGGMTIGLHIRRGDVHPWENEFEHDYLPVVRYMNEVREILITTYEDEHDETESLPDEGSPVHYNKPESKMLSHVFSLNTYSKPKGKPIPAPSPDLAKRHGPAGLMASQLLIASDDPMIYSAPELSRGHRAQERIVLASKTDLEKATGTVHRGPIDTLHGWEGGFFRSEFLALGTHPGHTHRPPGRTVLRGRAVSGDQHDRFMAALRAASASLPVHDPWHGGRRAVLEPTKEGMAMRELVGRSYLLDMAVLGRADAVVCAVSSAGCRVLGVMLGWDKVVGGGWRNVDGRYGWRGLVVP
jgi:hypothetical protein